MKPLIVLITVFSTGLMINRFISGDPKVKHSAAVAMSSMLVFAGIGHFVFAKGMALMLPDFVPFRLSIVYASGLIEIIAAILLLFPAYRSVVGWFLIPFFLLILPSNIYAAAIGLDIETGNLDGPGLCYLWFRVPMQLLLIGWIYYFFLIPPHNKRKTKLQ